MHGIFFMSVKKVTKSLFCKLDTRDFALVSTDTVELPFMSHSAHVGMTASRGGKMRARQCLHWRIAKATSACLH